MPRKSVASQTVAVLDTSKTRVKPPATMAAPIKIIWSQLVDSLPGDRFHASDRPLLALYCRSLHQAELAFDQLEKLGELAATSPWLKAADIASKQAAALALKLRLCPQSRLDRKTAGPAARNDMGGEKPWNQ